MHQQGPLPLVNYRPAKMRATEAEKFRNEHIPPVSKPDKLCPEKVNQIHPMLTEELAKRRWVKNPTVEL